MACAFATVLASTEQRTTAIAEREASVGNRRLPMHFGTGLSLSGNKRLPLPTRRSSDGLLAPSCNFEYSRHGALRLHAALSEVRQSAGKTLRFVTSYSF